MAILKTATHIKSAPNYRDSIKLGDKHPVPVLDCKQSSLGKKNLVYVPLKS